MVYSHHQSIIDLHGAYRDLIGHSQELVRAICADLGLRIVQWDLNELSGWTHKEFIVVNSEQCLARQTWSVGHELGHRFLNHQPPATSHEERHAHYWAGSLFMPRRMMRQFVQRGMNGYQIAREIGLSHEAVDRRLQFLDLHAIKDVPF